MDTIEIEKYARVIASDGDVGRVKHVIVDRYTREVVELVVERSGGPAWLVPITAVASAGNGIVRLEGQRGAPSARRLQPRPLSCPG